MNSISGRNLPSRARSESHFRLTDRSNTVSQPAVEKSSGQIWRPNERTAQHTTLDAQDNGGNGAESDHINTRNTRKSTGIKAVAHPLRDRHDRATAFYASQEEAEAEEGEDGPNSEDEGESFTSDGRRVTASTRSGRMKTSSIPNEIPTFATDDQDWDVSDGYTYASGQTTNNSKPTSASTPRHRHGWHTSPVNRDTEEVKDGGIRADGRFGSVQPLSSRHTGTHR